MKQHSYSDYGGSKACRICGSMNPNSECEGVNIFALFNSEEDAYLKLFKARLVIRITEWMRQQGYTQVQAAEKLRIPQSRLSNIKTGKLEKFSVDSLLLLALRAGVAPEVPSAKSEEAAR